MLTQNSKLKTQNWCCTDWHCHLLPGIDDGAATMEESVAMARALSAAGFTTVCCTPHLMKGSYDTSATEIRERTAQLQQRLAAESIPLKLLAGAEYYLDEYLLQLLQDPLPLGDTRQILVEISSHAPVEFVKETFYRIKCSGYTPLIAHPERCTLLEPKSTAPGKKGLWSSLFNSKLKTQNSELLDYLREIGCKFQGNLGSFAGVYGDRVRQRALTFLKSELYDCFGSDAHRTEHLEDLLKRGMQSVDRLKLHVEKTTAKTPEEG
jgi:protein-tyrosine phosphatase